MKPGGFTASGCAQDAWMARWDAEPWDARPEGAGRDGHYDLKAGSSDAAGLF
jgi:hypothetical protein